MQVVADNDDNGAEWKASMCAAIVETNRRLDDMEIKVEDALSRISVVEEKFRRAERRCESSAVLSAVPGPEPAEGALEARTLEIIDVFGQTFTGGHSLAHCLTVADGKATGTVYETKVPGAGCLCLVLCAR
jgi:hypothetical protein